MSTYAEFPITASVGTDAAALIALWLAIHGGDPAPGPVTPSAATALLAATLVTQLSQEFGEAARPLEHEELSKRLAPLGLRVDVHNVEEDGVTIRGGFVCVKGDDGFPGCCVRMASIRPPLR
jgi:hypothetical protein